MTITAKEHDLLLSCREHILSRLTEQMDKRAGDKRWIENERLAVAVSANEWAMAMANGTDKRVTVQDVKELEITAIGHVDYARKLSLRVAEFVLGLS